MENNCSNIYENKICNFKPEKPEIINEKIELENNEKELFSFLKEILIKNNLSNVILRVGGGWIRDKILNNKSSDIDIILENISPNEFIELINKEKEKKNSTFESKNLKKQKGIKIEYAKLIINNINIDVLKIINNPLEDSQRRDFTINSLFYNINEEKIEDFTKKGIFDLKNGIINTPIEPKDCFFKENDLGIFLRMIRFVCKYKFKISENIIKCIFDNNSEYRKIIENKPINSEKITKEFSNIFLSDFPNFGILILYKLNLLDSIIQIKNFVFGPYKRKDEDMKNLINIFLVGNYLFNKKQKEINFIEEIVDFKISFYYTLLLCIFKDLKNEFQTSVIRLLLSKIFILNIDITHDIINMIFNFDDCIKICNGDFNRVLIGKFIRKIKFKNLEKLLIIISSYQYIIKQNLKFVIEEINDIELDKIYLFNKNVYNYVIKENLNECDKIKPFISGKEIFEKYKYRFKNKNKSKWVSLLTESLIIKQIEIGEKNMNNIIAFETIENKINTINE